MVEVHVRHEHDVERVQPQVRGDRLGSYEVRGAPSQERIGQQSDSVELDQHRRVAEPGERGIRAE